MDPLGKAWLCGSGVFLTLTVIATVVELFMGVHEFQNDSWGGDKSSKVSIFFMAMTIVWLPALWVGFLYLIGKSIAWIGKKTRTALLS